MTELIFFSAFIAVFNAMYDFHLWNNGKSIGHGIRAVLRFVFITALSYISFGISLNMIWGAILGFSVFWIVFELGYNLLRNVRNEANPYYLFYVGTTAYTDKLIHKLLPFPAGIWLFAIKLVVLVGSILLLY